MGLLMFADVYVNITCIWNCRYICGCKQILCVYRCVGKDQVHTDTYYKAVGTHEIHELIHLYTSLHTGHHLKPECVLLCFAVCCSVLQCVAVRCSVCCNVLLCVVVHCSVLQHINVIVNVIET